MQNQLNRDKQHLMGVKIVGANMRLRWLRLVCLLFREHDDVWSSLRSSVVRALPADECCNDFVICQWATCAPQLTSLKWSMTSLLPRWRWRQKPSEPASQLTWRQSVTQLQSQSDRIETAHKCANTGVGQIIIHICNGYRKYFNWFPTDEGDPNNTI